MRPALFLACAFSFMAPQPLAAEVTQPCFWHSPNDLPVVDTNARYWRADFDLSDGERLEFRGTFPFARLMSFNLHRRSDNALLDAVTDTQLSPTAGSTNPFLSGAKRYAVKRDYTFSLAANRDRKEGDLTVGYSIKELTKLRLLYRIYLPDRRFRGGGVGLPRVWRVAPNGTSVELGGQCPVPEEVDGLQTIGPTRLPAAQGSPQNPIEWRGGGSPSNQSQGDLFINRDNAYAIALTDFRYGEVLVLTGIAPSYPMTWNGQRHARHGQVRYWSLCSYRPPSDRSASCLADEMIELDKSRRYKVVVSPRNLRPKNARAECGIGWVESMTESTGALLLRHVAPANGFTNTTSGLSSSQLAGPVLGLFEPVGHYASKASVETLGCANPIRR